MKKIIIEIGKKGYVLRVTIKYRWMNFVKYVHIYANRVIFNKINVFYPLKTELIIMNYNTLVCMVIKKIKILIAYIVIKSVWIKH